MVNLCLSPGDSDSPSNTWREPSGELERNFLPGHLVEKGNWLQTEVG